MAFTAEEIALKNSVYTAKNKMNDILYAFKGNYTGIENLSDIKYNFIDKTGKTYDSTKTYVVGDIVSYDFYAYISLVNSNINNTPFNNPTYWAKVETNTILNGEVFVAAHCVYYFPQNSDIKNSYIVNSHNISYVSYLGNLMFEVKFSDLLALSDSNYLVLVGGTTFNNTYDINNTLNIISKTKTGFIFKVPTNYNVYQVVGYNTFAVIPLQNEDFTI